MHRTPAGPIAGIRLGTIAAAVAVVVSACGSTTTSGTTGTQPPTYNIKPQASIGPGEGHLNLIAWAGYVDHSWADQFTAQTGCVINEKDDGSSDQMVTDMASGGGGNWDMVSASGDADLRLIYSGDVIPMNPALIPDWVNFQPKFQAPPFNTINGIHYGISLQWGPNTLLYNTDKFPTPPTSWGVIYDSQYKNLITIPDNAIQIADAALYLSKKQPSLGITDPYELTQPQFDATVNLLRDQRSLIKLYWAGNADEETAFTNGDVLVGAAWPLMTNDLKKAKVHVAETIPSEGATGWADTWMLAAKAPHPNCAYMWTKYVSTPHVQALQALSFGETPVNGKACAEMDSLGGGGTCHAFHADAPGSYFDSIKFWKTPIADCGNGSLTCKAYTDWQTAWTAIKG